MNFFFHIKYSGLVFPFLYSSEILSTHLTPCPFFLSVFRKQKQTKSKQNNKSAKKNKHKNQIHMSKIHKSTKSEAIIYKQKVSKTKITQVKKYEKVYRNTIELILS